MNDTETTRRAGLPRPARWVAALVLVAAWVWLALPSGLGGPLSLVWVRGESMEPTYVGGDLAVTYRTGSYDVGDVVAFTIPEGGIVIHRIVEVTDDGLVPRGDNRAHSDPWILGSEDIVGQAVLRIPAGGRVLYVLRQPLVLGILASATVVVAAWPATRGATEPKAVRG